MSTDIRLTSHAKNQLAEMPDTDSIFVIKELEEIQNGRFPQIRIYLHSVPFKGDENTSVLKIGRNFRLVYSETMGNDGRKIYLIQSIFKKA